MIKFLFIISFISLFAAIGFINEMGTTNWTYVAISVFIGVSAFIHALITMIQHDKELDNE